MRTTGFLVRREGFGHGAGLERCIRRPGVEQTGQDGVRNRAELGSHLHQKDLALGNNTNTIMS
jgi:hypothetical protein